MMKKIDQNILNQAAEWVIKIRSTALTLQEQQEFEQWKSQSKQHQQAWQRAQRLMATLQVLPDNMQQILLEGQQQHTQILPKLMIITGLAVMVGYFWQSSLYTRWSSDYSTQVGEQKKVILQDGTQLYLNTNTALDVHFTAQQRLITLHYGEISIQTGHEINTKYRPFIVENRDVTMQALGTIFNVRQTQKNHQTCLSVIESAVKITSKLQRYSHIIKAGEQYCFDQNQIKQNLEPIQLVWQQQVIMAYEMPLQDLVKELSRYHKGYIHLDSKIAQLKVSGSFPTQDTEKLSYALQSSYPITVQQYLAGRVIVIDQKTK